MKLTDPQKLSDLDLWLKCAATQSNSRDYYFLLLNEDPVHRNRIVPQLKQIARQAFKDFQDLIIEVYDANLDPLDSPEVQENKKQFLKKLDQILSIFDTRTLEGYLGETLTGLVVLGFNPFGIADWEIPVFLYRHHIHAYDAFEKWQQGGKFPKAIVGRAGEDNIAFLRDSQGNIIKELRCEAKCSAQHSSNLITNAHEKFDDSTSVSPEIFRIILVLRDYQGAKPKAWVKALRNHRWTNLKKNASQNLICYVSGQVPQRPKGRTCWIDQSIPHSSYKSSRPLQVVEIHLNDVLNLVCAIYDQRVKP